MQGASGDRVDLVGREHARISGALTFLNNIEFFGILGVWTKEIGRSIGNVLSVVWHVWGWTVDPVAFKV